MFYKRQTSNTKRQNVFAVFGFCLSAFGFCFLLQGCKQIDLYEKNVSIPNYKWSKQFAAEGSVRITDADANYLINAVLRHTDAYPYNNIILEVSLRSDNDSIIIKSKELILGADATGWEGSAMNDIVEVRKTLGRLEKPRPGLYRFSIRHLMRDEPLPGMLSAGLEIRKQ